MRTKKIKTPLSKKELKKRERMKAKKREKILEIMGKIIATIILLHLFYVMITGRAVPSKDYYPGRPSWTILPR